MFHVILMFGVDVINYEGQFICPLMHFVSKRCRRRHTNGALLKCNGEVGPQFKNK